MAEGCMVGYHIVDETMLDAWRREADAALLLSMR
jgi:hypothetical protein